MATANSDFSVKRTGKKVEIISDDNELLDKTKEIIDLVHNQLLKLQEAESEGLVDEMVSLLMTDMDPLDFRQDSLNAKARARHLTEYRLLTAEVIHEMTGSTSANRSSTATRWRKKGRIFAVKHAGRTLYPAYQFQEDGHPYPVIEEVLSVFGKDLQGWQIALWMISPNGWLDGLPPVEYLAKQPEAVVKAAKHEVKPGVY